MSATETASLESSTLRRFFDAIALRYDFLNHLLSFRLDDGWRKKSRDLILKDMHGRSLLDLGIGTGKFLQLFAEAQKWDQLTGLDFSSQMLHKAGDELHSFGTKLVNADFQYLPFQENSFDIIISAFTLRSVRDMPKFLKEVYEILAEGGKAGFLCLTRPDSFFFKLLYYPYLKIYLPLVGGLISGNTQAYRFLADSILSFQEPEKTAEMMERIGFRSVEVHRFTFGAATLIMGKK